MNPIGIFLTLLQVLEWIIIADALLSWFVPNADQFPRNMTSQIADPLCAPFRKLVGPERTGGFDLSPLITMMVLRLMRFLLLRSF
jgi:YggT family protein